jgi:hypothetical protein
LSGDSIVVSPDGSTLYVADVIPNNEVLAVDPVSGSYRSLGSLPGDYAIGAGIAVAVPEPSPLSLLFIILSAFALSVRRRNSL